jgi:hypothetical protein
VRKLRLISVIALVFIAQYAILRILVKGATFSDLVLPGPNWIIAAPWLDLAFAVWMLGMIAIDAVLEELRAIREAIEKLNKNSN